MCDPLIVHWPSGIGRPGETRHQYVHAVDLVPTLLDVIGIEAPGYIDGVAQSPFDGVSFAPTFVAATAPSAHTTQYYEMLGSRALYHDGWKAVVYHPPAAIVYDGSDARRSFEQDVWELYHVAEDFSECRDLATAQPEKLAELQQLWWAEAARNQVLPLNNEPGRYGDVRFVRERYVYHPGISSIPEAMAPNLRRRRYRILAVLDASRAQVMDGVIVCHGSHTGGYALFVKGRRLHFVHNVLGASEHRVVAEVELPMGPVIARLEFTPGERTGGTVALFYDDVAVGSGLLPATTPVTFGFAPFCVGAQPSSPICAELIGRAELPDGVLDHVVIEVAGNPVRSPRAEARAAQAMQ